MNPVDVTTAQLRDAARRLTVAAEDTDGVLAAFVSRVEGAGQPWGNDMLGMAIGGIYQAAMQLVLDAVRSNLDTVDGLAQRLTVAAENYDLTDQDAAGRLQSIRVPDAGL